MGVPHIVTEYGAVAQQLLPKVDDEHNIVFDAIVVGSGMGGGVVAASLADEKKKVLVLEAGSLLYPTHVGNIPRPIAIGKFEKHIWSQYKKWAVENYQNEDHSHFEGAQAFNLGGRSMFWGSSIPTLAQWELNAWPKSIQQYLTQGKGYELARETFNADEPTVLKEFHTVTSDIISKALGSEWDVAPAPVAVEYEGATEWSIPAGLFSTADLLLENTMTITDGVPGHNPGICVNLNHFVIDVIWKDNKAIGVNCVDMCKGKLRSFYAKTVILAAGTLESAKIAMQSKINNPLIGVGITDHPIKYRHFSIKADQIPGLTTSANKPQSTKLLIRHKSATIEHYAFDIIVELGTQWNQGRYVDHDHIADEMRERQGWIPCEIVVQFYSELQEDNKVTLGGWNKNVNIYMQPCHIPDSLHKEASDVAGAILASLQAHPVLNERNLWYEGRVDFDLAKLGKVAHEVGTLRMPVNGKKGVVDENLKVEGCENLYVCDNSVFPNSPAGNPSLTLVALARRCAKEVAQTIACIDHPELKVAKPIEQPTFNPPAITAAPVEVPALPVVEPFKLAEIPVEQLEIKPVTVVSSTVSEAVTVVESYSHAEIRSEEVKVASVVVTALAAEEA